MTDPRPPQPDPIPCRACDELQAYSWRPLTDAAGRDCSYWSTPPAWCPSCQENEQRRLHREAISHTVPAAHRGANIYADVGVWSGWTAAEARREHQDNGRFVATQWNRRALAMCRGWLPQEGWIVLVGPVGSGKTSMLAATLLAAAEEHRLWPVMATEAELLHDAREQIKHKGAGAGLLAAAAGADLLLLDDAGTTANWTDWCADQLEHLICTRYNAQRPTLISSNLELPALAERWGERAVSRIAECAAGRILRLKGWDWRTGARHA